MIGRRRAELLNRNLHVIPLTLLQGQQRPIVIAPLPDEFENKHRNKHGHRRRNDDSEIGGKRARAVDFRRLDERRRNADKELAEHEDIKAAEKARQNDRQRRIEHIERAHHEVERKGNSLKGNNQHDDDEVIDELISIEVDFGKRIPRHGVYHEDAEHRAQRVQQRIAEILEHGNAREYRSDIGKGKIFGHQIAEGADLRGQYAHGIERRNKEENQRKKEYDSEQGINDVHDRFMHRSFRFPVGLYLFILLRGSPAFFNR